ANVRLAQRKRQGDSVVRWTAIADLVRRAPRQRTTPGETRSGATCKPQQVWHARWPFTCFWYPAAPMRSELHILKGGEMLLGLLSHMRCRTRVPGGGAPRIVSGILLVVALTAACGTQRTAAVRSGESLGQAPALGPLMTPEDRQRLETIARERAGRSEGGYRI